MKIKFFVLICLFSLSYTHEIWIDLDNFYPTKQQKVKIYACSGHSFPKSDEIISEKFFDGFKVTNQKEEFSIKPKLEKQTNTLLAEFKTKEEGSFVAYFFIRKPQSKPLYYAKAIFAVEDSTSEVSSTIINKETLEIVLSKNPSQIKLKDKLEIKTFFEEKPISTTLYIQPENKKPFYITTNKEGTAYLEIKTPKRYLISSTYKGFTASLVFFVKEK